MGRLKKAIQPTRKNTRKAQEWFDTECYTYRKSALQALHAAKENRTIDNLEMYASKRKIYKKLIKEKKVLHMEKTAKKLAEEARKNPFLAQKPRKPRFPHDITMETWTNHLSSILNLNSMDTPAEREIPEHQLPFQEYTENEVEEVIRQLSPWKAAGPDGVFNEHIKSTSSSFLNVWTRLFNACMEKGNIPHNWRESTVKLLYKGKGDTSVPDSYRGIALESNILKIFTRLLMKRLMDEVEDKIPEQQFGFRRGRSCLH